MVEFHARRVRLSDNQGGVFVCLDEVGDGAEYLLFHRKRGKFNKLDKALGHAGIYLERRGQGWAAYGGIRRCELHRNRLRLRVTKKTGNLIGGDTEFEATFALTDKRFRQLQALLKKLFRGLGCFVDRSDGERPVRQGRNLFVGKLRRLYRKLFGPPSPIDGCSPSLIRECEGYQGFEVPAPLREYYLTLGENQILGTAHGLLLTPECLEVVDGHLVFWMEHEDQGGGWCAVPLDATDVADPAVVRQVFVSDDEFRWDPECRKLSWFLLRTLCWQAIWRLPVRATASVRPADCAKIAARFAVIAPPEPYEHETIAYAEDGLVICTSPAKGVMHVGARFDERLRALEHELSLTLERL